jgi:predicted alpha/beta superfamily hydrolase
VYALLNNDGLFRRFLIGSPSLFWDNKVMLKSEESYSASHKSMPARVYFAVGAEEGSMVNNLQDFAAQLKAHDYQGLEFDSQVFEGETHMSVIPTTISRGLRYLYASPAKDAIEKQRLRRDISLHGLRQIALLLVVGGSAHETEIYARLARVD